MSSRENTIRAIIASVLLFGGLFLMFCAVGSLDYQIETGSKIDSSLESCSAVEGLIGVILLGVSVFVGRNVEFKDD